MSAVSAAAMVTSSTATAWVAGVMVTASRRAVFLVRIPVPNGRRRAGRSSTALLRQQNSTNALVDGFQLGQIGRRDLDRVPGHRKHHNVLPRVEFVLVLHHLRALPVILNSSTLQGELFHFHRNGTASLRLNYCNVILGLEEVSTGENWNL